jgi:hypothetical protein
MGTSGSYGGAGNGSPLVPSWLNDPAPASAPVIPAPMPAVAAGAIPGAPPALPPQCLPEHKRTLPRPSPRIIANCTLVPIHHRRFSLVFGVDPVRYRVSF